MSTLYGRESLSDSLRFQWNHGGMVTRLIMINVGIYVFTLLAWIIATVANAGMESPFYTKALNWFMVSASIKDLVWKPWSLISYMFLQVNLFHLLFNMIVLYVFGNILSTFINDRRILPLYVLGGLAGAFFFILVYNLSPYVFPSFIDFEQLSLAIMLGSSGAVMAIMLATVALKPDYPLQLVFLGEVKIKYIALVMIIIDVLQLINNVNPGGHLAHLGGALFGYLFMRQLQQGNDWSTGFNKNMDALVTAFAPRKEKSNLRVTYKDNQSIDSGYDRWKENIASTEKQQRIDAILDKIKENGYDSLPKADKEFLFQYSQEE